MEIQELSDKDYKEEIAKHDLAIVDVYASWCGNCRLFASSFKEVAQEYPEYQFYKIDGDQNQDFSGSIEMDNLPFIAVYHKGKFLGGKSTAKKEGLLGMIQKLKEKL